MKQFDYTEKWKKLLTPEIVPDKIEGIYTSDECLKKIVLDKTMPSEW